MLRPESCYICNFVEFKNQHCHCGILVLKQLVALDISNCSLVFSLLYLLFYAANLKLMSCCAPVTRQAPSATSAPVPTRSGWQPSLSKKQQANGMYFNWYSCLQDSYLCLPYSSSCGTGRKREGGSGQSLHWSCTISPTPGRNIGLPEDTCSVSRSGFTNSESVVVRLNFFF